MEEERFLEALFGGRCALVYFVGVGVRECCHYIEQRNFNSSCMRAYIVTVVF